VFKKTNFKKDATFIISLFIISTALLLPFFLFKDNFIIISSPSMKPTLNIGDLIIKQDKDPIDIRAHEKYGDILVLKGPQYFYSKGFNPLFWNNLPINTIIVHRAIDKKIINNTYYFLTKGDNNLFPDGAYKILNTSKNNILVEINISKGIYIPQTEILGVVAFKIPFIGYLNIYFIPILIIALCILFVYFLLKILKYQIKIEKTL
jgi:signal peptidase I